MQMLFDSQKHPGNGWFYEALPHKNAEIIDSAFSKCLHDL